MTPAPESEAASQSRRAQEVIPCNLCGSRDVRVLYDEPPPRGPQPQAADARFAATTDEFGGYGRIVRCRACRLVYRCPRPAADELHREYAACTDEAYRSESISRSINAYLSLRTLKKFVSRGRLLEVGPAAGYFLNAARVDFDVVGVEPSLWACRHIRERFNIEVHPGTMEAAAFLAPETFDAVVMMDVIEHLTDPQAALRRAAELLRPGGILHLVTPDIGGLMARLCGRHWWGLRPAHLYYFDRVTLPRMLEQAGLETILMKSFGRIFSYDYWASRLRHYPAWIYRPIKSAIAALDISDKLLYIDTRDSLELCARKR